MAHAWVRDAALRYCSPSSWGTGIIIIVLDIISAIIAWGFHYFILILVLF